MPGYKRRGKRVKIVTPATGEHPEGTFKHDQGLVVKIKRAGTVMTRERDRGSFY